VTLCHHHGGSSGAKGFVGSEGTVSAPWTLQEKRLPGWEPLPWRGLRWTSVGLRFRHTRARRVAGRPGFDGEVIRWVSRGLAEIGARPCRALNPPYGTKKAANRNARRGFPAGPNSRISIYRVNRFVGLCQAGNRLAKSRSSPSVIAGLVTASRGIPDLRTPYSAQIRASLSLRCGLDEVSTVQA
jgi:hypothetical protein